MTSDSALFARAPSWSEAVALSWATCSCRARTRFWPLYEAKMIHHFTHRFGDYALKRPDYGKNDLPTPDDATLANPAYAPLPRYWVAEAEVERQLAGRWGRGWLLGWRNVCRNTDERTVIAAILPRVAVGYSMPLLFASVATPALYACLLANLSAFVLDYAARQKLGGLNLTYGYRMQLPILPPHAYSSVVSWSRKQPAGDWICERVLELTYTAYDLRHLALDLGHEAALFLLGP